MPSDPRGLPGLSGLLKIAERVYAPLTAAIRKRVDGDSRFDSTKLTEIDRAYQAMLTSLDRLPHELGLQAD